MFKIYNTIFCKDEDSKVNDIDKRKSSIKDAKKEKVRIYLESINCNSLSMHVLCVDIFLGKNNKTWRQSREKDGC